MFVLLFSCFGSAFYDFSFFVSGAPDKVVSSEAELKNAVSGAVSPIVIALGGDITLTGSLIIPVNKDITLIRSGTGNVIRLKIFGIVSGTFDK